MNLEQLRASGQIILDVVAGSHMYGLNIESSDVDHRGIFNMPVRDFVLPYSCKQIACEKNDEVYYEVARFLELAKSANPNILEIMFAPESSIVYKDPRMDIILKNRDKFLTKMCRSSLGGYAVAQIRKARGQNKMVTQPEVKRKTILDFCYAWGGNEASVPLKTYLENYAETQDNIGLAKVNNFDGVYAMYAMNEQNWSIVNNFCGNDDINEFNAWKPSGMINAAETSTELRLTTIPKVVADHAFLGLVSYNKDGWVSHCRDYKRYQDWVAARNPDRFEANLETLKTHKKFYDKKNMMHCFRLLRMGLELAETGELNVYRTDRDFLLKIRRGELDYDYLIDTAEGMISQLDEAFENSSLPVHVKSEEVNEMLLEFKFG